MNEYEKTKKWLADYLKCQFVSENAPDDECVREAEFVLSNPLIQIKADEQSLPFISLRSAELHDEKWAQSNFTDSLQEFGRVSQKELLNDNWVKVVKKEAQDDG